MSSTLPKHSLSFKTRAALIILYEIIVLSLLIPHAFRFVSSTTTVELDDGGTRVTTEHEWARHPATVDMLSVSLSLALFLPFALPFLRRLSAFGVEVEVQRDLDEKIDKTRRDLSLKSFEHERALFLLATSIAGEMLSEVPARGDRPLRIGRLDFVESHILSELLFLRLEERGIAVERAGEHPTVLAYLALRRGQIDLFAGYSGAALRLLDEPDHELSADEDRERLNKAYERWGFQWLEPLSFENRGFLVMLKKKADALKLNTVEDLMNASRSLRFGAPHEFFVRPTSFPLMRRQGFRFSEIHEIDLDDRFSGIFADHFDVGYGWSTDPEMRKDGPLQRFGFDCSQHVIPVCRKVDSKRVEEALAGLRLSEEQMRKLLQQAARVRNNPDAVENIARKFYCKNLKSV